MKNKIKNQIRIILIVLALAFLFLPFVYSEEDLPPQKILTIQSFLADMKAHPDNYYVIINRTQTEIDYLNANSSLKSFLDYFNVKLSTSFKDDCKNFVLIEIPETYLGSIFGLRKDYSYMEAYQDAFLQDQPMEYYLANKWCVFNYTLIYIIPQDLYFDFSDLKKEAESNQKISQVDKDKNGFLDPTELAIYSLNKFIERDNDFLANPIKTDYVVLDEKNQIKELNFGERDFCFVFNTSNNIFTKYTYELPSLNISEFCIDKTFVSELVCSSGRVISENIPCPSNYICSNGACVPKENTQRNTIIVLVIKFLSGHLTISEIVKEIESWIRI